MPNEIEDFKQLARKEISGLVKGAKNVQISPAGYAFLAAKILFRHVKVKDREKHLLAVLITAATHYLRAIEGYAYNPDILSKFTENPTGFSLADDLVRKLSEQSTVGEAQKLQELSEKYKTVYRELERVVQGECNYTLPFRLDLLNPYDS
ncbi:hypothetical protein HY486_00180 [Candidatus Woesearchaeota archaeon]|nr:hypothetical protein [Candidatus Woesearchaeota archaeon]